MIYKLKSYKWGTNIPAIKAILEVFQPPNVMELGAGLNSTPLFKDIKCTSIETDFEWVQKVRPLIPSNVKLVHHDLGIHFKRTFTQIDETIRKESVEFYKQYLEPDMEFLFVDHVVGLRIYSLLSLMEFFPVIAYHDAEEKKLYSYDLIDSKGYIHLINKTPIVWTGILIKDELSFKIPQLIKCLTNNNKEYCNKFGVKYDGYIKILK